MNKQFVKNGSEFVILAEKSITKSIVLKYLMVFAKFNLKN